MHNDGNNYFENGAATAFSCRYLNGLEFIGILPKQTGDFTIESLDIPSLLESRSSEYDVSAAMPRLEFETELPLTESLKAFGLSDIFAYPQRCPFWEFFIFKGEIFWLY